MPNVPQPFWARDHGWALFLCAFALRLALLVFILIRFGDAGFIMPPFSDGHGYVTAAENMLHGNGFSREEQPPYIPDTKRVPLYPLFLSVTLAVSGGALWLAAFLQTLVGALTTLLVYRTTCLIAPRRAAFFAGLLAAIYPFGIFLSTQILAETLFTFVLCGSFLYLIRALISGRSAQYVLSGLLLGISTLVKPAGQYIAFLALPFAALAGNGRERLIRPAVLLICFLAVISPWVIRNKMVSGIATVSYEANILFDLHIAGYTALKETGSAANFDRFRIADTPEKLLQTSRGTYIQRIASIVLRDPLGFTRYLALTTVPFVFGDGFVTMAQSLAPGTPVPAWNFSLSFSAFKNTLGFGTNSLLFLVLSFASKLLWGSILLCAIYGAVRLLKENKKKRLVVYVIAIVTAYFMFAGGPVQSSRYRAPVEPLIFMLAGIGIAALLERRNPPQAPQPPSTGAKVM